MIKKAKTCRKAILAVSLALMLLSGTLFVSEKAFCAGESKRDRIVKEIYDLLKQKRMALTDTRLKSMANTLFDEAARHDVDYRLVLAIIKVESNFRHNVTARDGSLGLMQLQPSLARGIARKKGEVLKGPRDLHEPEKNVRLGTYHVAKLMEDHESINAALLVYNAGIGKARKSLAKGIEPDTPFINKVLREYHRYMKTLPDPYEAYESVKMNTPS